MTYRLFFAIILTFLSFSCSQKGQNSETHGKIKTTEELFHESIGHIALYDSLINTDKELITNFYRQNNYTCLFHDKKGNLTASGRILDSILTNTLYFGLPQNRIYIPAESDDKISEDIRLVSSDVQLTIGSLRLLSDLANGFSDSLKLKNRNFDLADFKHLSTFKSISNRNVFYATAKSFLPDNKHYLMLAEALKNHLDTADISLKLFEVPLSQKDSALAYKTALENLKRKEFSFSENEDPIDVIKRYQKQNNVRADGIIGQATKHILEESPLDLAERIAWYMEKARYERSYPKKFIRVNIPAFKLYYFNEDTIASIHNVVVGKVENTTPVLESKLNRIQLYPYWNVPYSIATKEILPAIKNNPDYLERNQMELLKGDKVVNPHLINWKKLNKNNFPYKVRQLPGHKNSLGIIKFEFYNKYDVYIHDTPQKGLLETPNRMYSHGCVRCQNPIELAKKILEIDENKIIPDSLDTLLSKGDQYLIRLKKSIPVYIEYSSISITPVLIKKHKDKPDEYEEQIFYFRDIYFTDEKTTHYFFGKKKLEAPVRA